MSPAVAALASAVALSLVLVAPARGSESPAGSGDDGGDTQPRSDAGWRVVMERAVEASRSSAYQGRLLIAAVGDDGPTLAEVDIAQGTGGGMRVGRAEAWMVGRDSEEAFYFRREAGNLLRLGNVERIGFDVDELTRNYAVSPAGTRELRFGPAIVLAVRERDADHDRERLFVDEATGLVVRRETFAGDGTPQRVVAYTELEVVELSMERPAAQTDEHRGAGRAVSEEGLDILSRTGWAVPRELPHGFRLRNGYALPDPAGSSLHLVYSDGLYTLSVYEQPGRLDIDAISGASRHAIGDHEVWRWPGSEPERMVWSAEDLTFTAVSDAPMDVVTEAVAGLPGERPSSFDRRLVRGLRRVGGWLWPFD